MSGVDPVNRYIETALIAPQNMKLKMKHTYPIASSHVYAGEPERSNNVFFMHLIVWYMRSDGFCCC